MINLNFRTMRSGERDTSSTAAWHDIGRSFKTVQRCFSWKKRKEETAGSHIKIPSELTLPHAMGQTRARSVLGISQI
jgi:hypothetical protein